MSRNDRKKPDAAKSRTDQSHSARARRTREPAADTGLRSASFVFRHRVGNSVVALLLVVAAVQLFNLQVSKAEGLRAEAAGQLKVTDVEKAVRGSIVDRNADKLAFTIEARALTFQPIKVQKQLAETKAKTPSAPDPTKRLAETGDARGDLRSAEQQAGHRDHPQEADRQGLLRLPGPRR
jgi:cell division protein FtsI (penicillin-binding protein 3)